MEDLVPILFHYVKSREKPRGYVLWVGHNARVFDVPFIINEFRRCSTQIPPNWLFVDTLPLARQLMKSEGSFSFLHTHTHTHTHTVLAVSV
jgi:DNA polymerase III epsilon subunit-like protein